MAPRFASASVSTNKRGLPRRGQIKARIFKSIIKTVAAAVLIGRTTAAPMASNGRRSDRPVIPTTPPTSSYSSDG